MNLVRHYHAVLLAVSDYDVEVHVENVLVSALAGRAVQCIELALQNGERPFVAAFAVLDTRGLYPAPRT